MPTFRAPRGTRDLLPPETATWTRLERLAADLAARYGYRRIETPMFELTDVFERGVGEVTDIVEKELFRLAPRTEDGEALGAPSRADRRASSRAYVQHGMQTWPQPVKLSEIGPMFRYDRPQAGRYRQFWQFDIEAIGDAGPAIDAEIIELGSRFYRDAGLEGVEVHLNSIGDAACRPAYVAELTDYFRAHVAELPELERDRLERNVLRLLDSNDPAMAALNEAAPQDHRPPVRCLRGALRRRPGAPRRARTCPYRLEPGLVRGLDYYTRTAFEFYVTGREGQQQAIGGGGRYDGLVELLGGRPTPGHRVRDRARPADPCPDRDRGGSTAAETGPVAVVVGADPDDTAGRLVVATDLRGGGDRGPGRARPPQARQAARSRGARARPLRGHHRRRAGRRRGRPARPAGRDPEARRASPTWPARSSAPMAPTGTGRDPD